MPRFVNAHCSMPSSRRSGGISLHQRQQHHHHHRPEVQSQGGLSFPDTQTEASTASPSSHVPPHPQHPDHHGDCGDGGIVRDHRDDHCDEDDDDATALNNDDSSGDEDEEDGRSVELLPTQAATGDTDHRDSTITTSAAAATLTALRGGRGSLGGGDEDEDDGGRREGEEGHTNAENGGAKNEGATGAKAQSIARGEEKDADKMVVRSPASRTLDALDSINASQDAVSLFCADDDVGGIGAGAGTGMGEDEDRDGAGAGCGSKTMNTDDCGGGSGMMKTKGTGGSGPVGGGGSTSGDERYGGDSSLRGRGGMRVDDGVGGGGRGGDEGAGSGPGRGVGPSSSATPPSSSASGPTDRSSSGGDGKCHSDRLASSVDTRDERREDGILDGPKYRHNNAVEHTSVPKRVIDNGGARSMTAPTAHEECRNDDYRSHDDDDEEEEDGRRNRDVIFAKQRAKMEARSRARSQQRVQGQKRTGCHNDDVTTAAAAATTSSKKSKAAKTSEVGRPGKREEGAVAVAAASRSSASRRNDGGDDDDSGIKFRVACKACRREARRRRTAAPPTLSESSVSSSDEGEDPEAHHSLCRRNPRFDQYLLDLCRLGVRMGCRSCANHALFNEARGARHLKNCRRHRNYEQNATKEWQSRKQQLQTRKDKVETSKGAPTNASKKKPKKKTVVLSKSTVARSAVSIGKKNKQSQTKKLAVHSQKAKQKSSKMGGETRRQKEAGSSVLQRHDDRLPSHAGTDDEGETDCRACQRERLTGKKNNLFHRASCPRGATDARNKPINASMASKTSLGQARSDSDTRLLASSSSTSRVPSGRGSQNKNKNSRAASSDSRQVTPSSQEGEDGPTPSPYDLCYPDEEDEEDNCPRWESCPNPWGDFGHVDGDVVLFTPSSSTVGGSNIVGIPTCPDSIIPKRFALDPMSVTSPYTKTHAGGDGVGQGGERGGYSVLLLKRDRLALRPWGFSTQLHEFGGACLVSMVSPCSPAEAAVDVGGFGCPPCPRTVGTDDVYVSAQSEPPAGSARSSGLRVNDMILCVNGKIVGGMSEVELAVELEISGPEIVLVVSRCLDRKRGNAALLEASEHERKSWYSTSFAGRNGLNWNDIGMDNGEDDEHRGCHQSRTSVVKKRKIGELRTTLEVEHSNSKDTPGSDGHRTMDTPKLTKRVSFVVHDNIQTVTESAVMPKTDHSIIQTGDEDDRDEPGNEIRSCSPVVDEYGSGDIVKRGSCGDGFDVDSDDDSMTDRTTPYHDGESTDEPDPPHEPEEKDEEEVEHAASVGSTTDANVFDGDEPWLGCVCGKTHPEPIVVFWIQCDTCRAWYNVANECVGFSEDEANDMVSWECSSCLPSASKPAETATQVKDDSTNPKEPDQREQRQQHPRSSQSAPLESSDDDDDDDEAMSKPHVIIPVSTIVDVAERTWPGSNKLGGVGRVTNIIIDSSSGSVAYDVSYVLGGKEKAVPSKYVSVHDDIYSSSQSTLGTRASRR